MNLQQQGNPALTLRVSGAFAEILTQLGASLAISMIPGRLVFIGPPPAPGRLWLQETPMQRSWGLAYHPQNRRLALANLREVVVFADNSRLAPYHEPPCDVFFAPRVTFHVGDCMMHDLAYAGNSLLGVNTRFASLVRIDGAFSFTPIWQPPFISAPLPEDRCHLNGVAVESELPRYATAFGVFDQKEAWREHSPNQGILIEIDSGRIVNNTLSMPHSPRLINGRLLLTEMGRGTVVEIDPVSGEKRTLAQLPGLTRGLCEHQGVLFAGLSAPRPSRNRWHLPVYDSGRELISGIAALDARDGKLLGLLHFSNGCGEVFDIQILPDITRPGVFNAERDRLAPIDTPASGYWMPDVEVLADLADAADSSTDNTNNKNALLSA
jgi:uncharacterized protein (TIGR03032 family)